MGALNPWHMLFIQVRKAEKMITTMMITIAKAHAQENPPGGKKKECTIGEMGFYTIFLSLFYFSVVFERIDSSMMKRKWSTNPKKNFLAIPVHLLHPLPRGMYVFFSLHLSALSF